MSTEGDRQEMVWKRSKRKQRFAECCSRMPALPHSIDGKTFDAMDSEVCQWLSEQPEMRLFAFEVAKENGMIEYDPETKTWRGVRL